MLQIQIHFDAHDVSHVFRQQTYSIRSATPIGYNIGILSGAQQIKTRIGFMKWQ
jgi:hypothetical protein